MAYVCTECGKTKKLPDFCCGKSMLSEGKFFCNSCGSSYDAAGNCCDQSLNEV